MPSNRRRLNDSSISNSQDNDGFGVAFCVQDATHHYLFAMDEERGFHVLAVRDGKDYRVLAKNSGGYEPNVWHQIRIVQDVTKLTVFVNGEKDLEATDDTYSSGSIGLYCWGAQGASFRNIAVLPR